ncbi:MAG: nuclear transport factor 2 family protein [Polyangiaceae bacterium]|nr:nuclear transport factor 2 family protein [Polyangiaceae bacterium]MCB9608840.1 nuclear transport factor 2 family protein [Polyangiaceae bacterium]
MRRNTTHLTPKQVALAYIDACSRKDFGAVAALLAADLEFVGPGNRVTGAKPYLAILERLGSVWERSDVKHTFSDGDNVCVIYDFVTNTEAGAVPIVEWLTVNEQRIQCVKLFFDRVSFQPASAKLASAQ